MTFPIRQIGLSLVALLMVLSGCATTGAHQAPYSAQKRMETLAPWASGPGKLVVIEVPAANNAISTAMAAGSLKMGGSSLAADQIVQLLRSGSVGTVAVIGESDAMNAATVQAALRQLQGTAPKDKTTLVLVGEHADTDSLKAVAASTGVKLVFAR